MATPDENETELGWDEPTTESPARAAKPRTLPVLWDEHTTEDEASKNTRIVDSATLLGQLEDQLGFLAAAKEGLGGGPSSEEPTTDRRAQPAARVVIDPESTPALGTSYLSALLSKETAAVREKRELDEARAASAAEVMVDEVSLNPEEAAAIEAEVAATAARSDLKRVRELLEGGDWRRVVLETEALVQRLSKADTRLRETARRFLECARDILDRRYAELLEGRRVPRVVLDSKAIACLKLDHRAGFFLSQIDGSSTVQEILDVCGTPQIEALAILYELHELEIVTFDAPA